MNWDETNARRPALRKLLMIQKDIGVAQTRIGEILSGQRSITADTTWHLSRYFGNSAQFWLNLQAEYDLRQAQLENGETYLRIVVSPALQAYAHVTT